MMALSMGVDEQNVYMLIPDGENMHERGYPFEAEYSGGYNMVLDMVEAIATQEDLDVLED